MSKLFVPLQRKEFEALFRLAESELRDPRQQAAVLIRRELEQRGLLPKDPSFDLVYESLASDQVQEWENSCKIRRSGGGK